MELQQQLNIDLLQLLLKLPLPLLAILLVNIIQNIQIQLC
jgi:hypothetical protein